MQKRSGPGSRNDNNNSRGFKRRDNDDNSSFKKESRSGKPFEKKGDKPFGKKDSERSFRSREDGDRKPFPKKDGERSFRQDGDKTPFPKRSGEKRFIKEEDKPFFKRKAAEPKPEKPVKDIYEPLEISEEKKNNKKAPAINKAPGRGLKKETNEPISSRSDNKPYFKEEDEDQEDKKPSRKRIVKQSAADALLSEDDKKEQLERQRADIKAAKATARKKKFESMNDDDDDMDDESENVKEEGAMPLNKYLAHSGVCSRREAANEVKAGKVRVNDKIETNPAYKVADSDVVYYNDKKLKLQKGMVYILLNKPKDFITTNDDPQGRKTVMDLVANSGEERLFPVGRLDRNTTGLLLMTNDGDLTQKLAHPSFKVKKIYQVTTDKPVTKADFDKILNGLELEDGKATVDALAYLEKKNELGIEIHIGRNRIVRRIFESLGYEVEKLDRVMYGPLTKKNLPRGKWRYLNEREIVLLKHFKS